MATGGTVQAKTVTVNSAQGLSAALAGAQNGTTILLAGGNYGDVTIRSVNTSGGVTIKSADADKPAVLNSLKVLNSSNLSFDHIDVKYKPTLTSVAWASAVSISDSSNISITHADITGGKALNGVPASATVLDATGNVLGMPTGRGVTLARSNNITISESEISTFAKGIVAGTVNGLKIIDNEIHELRTTPISGGDVRNVLIDGNHLYDSKPWNFGGSGDHGDFIHFWTTPGGKASTNITITDNFLDQGALDAMLGIYLDDNGNKVGYTGVNISNNVISNDDAQAIRLENVRGAVSHNTLIQPRPSTHNSIPGVVVTAGSNISLTDNLLGRITVTEGASAKQSGNVMTTRTGSTTSLAYEKLFANALSKHPTLADLAMKANTAVGDAGADLTALLATGWGVRTQTTREATVKANGKTAVLQADGTFAAADTVVQHLVGTAGADSLSDAKGASIMEGGAGDDKYTVTKLGTVIIEAANGGTDTVIASVDHTLSANVENLTLQGTATTGIGNDADNMIRGNDLGNTLHGLGGNDIISGGSGNDYLYGGDGNDSLNGNDGNDYLYGDAGNDVLNGGAGNDWLFGGAGDDRLTGGAGQDVMSGGAGADRFIFGADDFVDAQTPDRITDFDRAEGDKIALNGIDANIHTAVDDKFAFIGTNAFSKVAGELRYVVTGKDAMVMGDVDGDGVADFQILLNGVTKLMASDFIL